MDARQLKRYRDRRFVAARKDYRDPAVRDRDRILYSAAFRRLAAVTQTVGLGERAIFHNRLTHSLKVAQVGESLALSLLRAAASSRAAGGIHPPTVGAAGLAHDIGHPPFGHVGEKVLQDKISERGATLDGFEGNAQSFRILTKLSTRTEEDDELGLNLTRATLDAVLKYPWHKGEHPSPEYSDKWAAYQSEHEELRFARQRHTDRTPSVEAQLMDWADDVTYAVHDVEDFYRAGLIPLDRLHDERESEGFLGYAKEQLAGQRLRSGERMKTSAIERYFEGLLRLFIPRVPFAGTRRDRGRLHELASGMITRYVDAVSIRRSGGLELAVRPQYEVALLKQLTWYFVIDKPELATLQGGHRRVVGELFDDLCDRADEAAKHPVRERRLPVGLSESLRAVRVDPQALRFAGSKGDEVLRVRAVTDFIASLTDAQAIEWHRRLTGSVAGSVLDAWVRL